MSSSKPSSALARDELTRLIKLLGLRGLAANLDDFLARAQKGRWPASTVVEELIRQEARDRERRSLEARLAKSRLGSFKHMADFDWAWPRSIDRHAVERALTGDFVARGENLILIAAQGLGKTMIAKNVVYNAVAAGHTALFIEASQMLLDLSAQESPRALERRLKHYAKPRLLCIDEVGYLAYDTHAADLLFQVVSRRYGKKSIIVSTNIAFSEWKSVFPNAMSVTTLIDRLIHFSEIIDIDGDSYRRREAEERKAKRGDARTGKPNAKNH